MSNLLAWMKSTRSVAVVLVLGLLYVVVIASALGRTFPNEILALVGSVITGVVVAYFGKRDLPDGPNGDA